LPAEPDERDRFEADPAPEAPVPANSDDCCGSGCERCLFGVYPDARAPPRGAAACRNGSQASASVAAGAWPLRP